MYLLLLNLIDDSPPGAGDEEQVQRLVALARQGDEVAARRLYRMFATRVFRAVRPLATSDADAEDVVQDTFVKALGSLHRYQRQAGKRFVAWLMTIALNTARKQARRQQRWRPLSEERGTAQPGGGSDAERDPLGAALDRQRLATVLLEALQTLPERERQILLLRYGAELTATEVSQLVGEAPATVRKICERQRRKLLAQVARVTSTSTQTSTQTSTTASSAPVHPVQESLS